MGRMLWLASAIVLAGSVWPAGAGDLVSGPVVEAVVRADWVEAARQVSNSPAAKLLSGYAALERGDWLPAWQAFGDLEKSGAGALLARWADAVRAAKDQAAIPYLLLGDAQARLKDYAGALRSLDAAIARDPKLAHAFNLRGLVNLFQQDQDYDRAAADFKTAAALNAQAPDPSFNLGVLFILKTNYDSANSVLTSLLEQYPDHFLARNARGVAASMRGDYQLAGEDFDRVLREVPQFRVAAVNKELMERARAQGIFDLEQLATGISPRGTLGQIVNIVIVAGAGGRLFEDAVGQFRRAMGNPRIAESPGQVGPFINQGARNIILKIRLPEAMGDPLGRNSAKLREDIDAVARLGAKPALVIAGYEAFKATGEAAPTIRGKVQRPVSLDAGVSIMTLPSPINWLTDRVAIQGNRDLGTRALVTDSASQQLTINTLKNEGFDVSRVFVTPEPMPGSVSVSVPAGKASVTGSVTPLRTPSFVHSRGVLEMESQHPSGGLTRRDASVPDHLRSVLNLGSPGSGASGSAAPERRNPPGGGIQISFHPDSTKVLSAGSVDPCFLARNCPPGPEVRVEELPADARLRFPFLFVNP